MNVQSWGRYPHGYHAHVSEFYPGQTLRENGGPLLLAYGQGRSYGDSCLNFGHDLLKTGRLNRFLDFNAQTGVVRVETGVTISELIEFSVPRGWFPPVVPGTRHVSMGGAIANDIHGKNHHRRGSFGCHVRMMEILRSNGETIRASREKESDLFYATIGGLGLTGIVIWIELQLVPVKGPYIEREFTPFHGLSEFISLSAECESTHEYCVAWLDILGRGKNGFRGVFFRGNHANKISHARFKFRDPSLWIPSIFPSILMAPASMRAFNFCYRGLHRLLRPRSTVSLAPFFFPLDGVRDWNRVYGPDGFTQFQLVVPNSESGRMALEGILERVAEDGTGSFLSVLKIFGSQSSGGYLSFPRPGFTLTMDFPARPSTFDLLRRLESDVVSCGGAIYPAKDAMMSPTSFRSFFPKASEFIKFVDPRFSSSFWRRVSGSN